MSEIEQTDITIKRGKVPTSNLTRQEISEKISGINEIEKREKEHLIANYNIYGKGKFVQEGSKDRLLGRYPILPTGAIYESDKLSYYGGYYAKGSRNLVIYVRGKVPEYISTTELLSSLGYSTEEYSKIKIEEAINKMLTKIGYIDRQNERVIYEELPLEVQNNIYYNAGYNMTLEKENKKSRN